MSYWKKLDQEEQINKLIEQSHSRPILIFKHSTTCGISHSAKSRVDAKLDQLADEYDLYYLDLLSYRSVSNLVAKELEVIHQSPQVIIIKNGTVVHTSSHYAIVPDKLLQVV